MVQTLARAWSKGMAVVILNPNSTASMTDSMLEVARSAAPGLEFEGWTSRNGPPTIQGEADGAAATPPLLDLVAKASEDGVQGIIIGCFDDTALHEAAELAKCPVIGIGQASYHYAALRNFRFSVVTTLAVSVPIIETNIRKSGLSAGLKRVRASDVAVLELEEDVSRSSEKVVAEAQASENEDGVDCLILGCAGMVNVTKAVTEGVGVRVVDPVATAARCIQWIMAK